MKEKEFNLSKKVKVIQHDKEGQIFSLK